MPETPDAFLDRLVADLQPVAPLRQRNGMAFALLALVLGSLVVVSLLGLRPDFAFGRPNPLALTASGVFLVLALASAWAAIDMARPAVGTRRDGWGWTALMAAVIPVAALALTVMNFLAGRAIDIDRSGLSCLVIGSVTGLLTAAVLVVWLRRGAPSSPAQAGLLTGVAAGAAGIFAVSLWCQHDGLLHIGIWHGAAIAAMGLIGRIALPRILAW